MTCLNTLQNVAIKYRWAEHHNDRLPQLAAELVQVIVAGGCPPSALAAKTATSTIPIVFEVAIDPIKAELVTSLNRPGGNITGVVNLNVEVAPKWLELIRELTPTAATIAVLLNPTYSSWCIPNSLAHWRFGTRYPQSPYTAHSWRLGAW